MRMKIFGDYHTHTKYSDGHNEVIDLVKEAEKQGLSELGITDHSFNMMFCGMTRLKFKKISNDIAKVKTDLKILKGVEANILSTGMIDIPKDLISKFDYINCGFHRFVTGLDNFDFFFTNGFGNLEARKKRVDTNTAIYIKIIESGVVDTLVHLNHRCLVDSNVIVQKAKENGVYIELNEKHIESLEPNFEDLNIDGVKFILGSDAHRAEKVGKFEKILEFIKKYNIDQELVYGFNGKTPEFKRK